MAEISAALVKELRDRTGAGMMDCKRALQETNGDMEAAIVVLREKGMAQAAKRAGRETTEGKVGYRLAEDGCKGTMVAVGCETEPVSNNDEFLAYAKKVLDAVDAKRRRAPRRSSTTSASSCRRSSARTSSSPAPRASRRSTARSSPRTRIRRRTSSACSCRCAAATTSSRRSIAMHIACVRPRWIDRDDVPGGGRRRGARDLRQLRRGAGEAGAGAREDRRRHAEQALLRGTSCLRRPGRGSTTPRRPSARR